MKTLFTGNRLEGINIFIDKLNWKITLNFLNQLIGETNFFFFFGSERGSHLKIFTPQISDYQIAEIEKFLIELPKYSQLTSQDPLFKNAEQNTVHRFSNIDSRTDFVSKKVNFYEFICQTSETIISALNYNDFFLEEKSRINMALQLAFLALVKTDKKRIFDELYLDFCNSKEQIPVQLINFFNEIQAIESEEETQKWVLDWISNSSAFLTDNKFNLLLETITQILEIREFTETIAKTTYLVLNSVGIEI